MEYISQKVAICSIWTVCNCYKSVLKYFYISMEQYLPGIKASCCRTQTRTKICSRDILSEAPHHSDRGGG